MSRRRLIAAGCVALALAIAWALHRGVHLHRHRMPGRPAPTATATGAARPALTPLRRAEVHFAESYALYLDGGSPSRLRDASITASAQARQAGRIPPAFRDGPLSVLRISGSSGAYSALATVLVGDREERYPFSLQALRGADGWVIAQLTPPDLVMDRHTAPAATPAPPAAAAATRRFVLAYARYRAQRRGVPDDATPAATRAMAAGDDSLAGVTLGSAAPRLISLAFGPVDDGELAATAAVRFGDGTQHFSVLMASGPGSGGWACAAFL